MPSWGQVRVYASHSRLHEGLQRLFRGGTLRQGLAARFPLEHAFWKRAGALLQRGAGQRASDSRPLVQAKGFEVHAWHPAMQLVQVGQYRLRWLLHASGDSQEIFNFGSKRISLALRNGGRRSEGAKNRDAEGT